MKLEGESESRSHVAMKARLQRIGTCLTGDEMWSLPTPGLGTEGSQSFPWSPKTRLYQCISCHDYVVYFNREGHSLPAGDLTFPFTPGKDEIKCPFAVTHL